MGQRVLAENAGVKTVEYTLPNKHYIPVDMKYIGVDNTTPYVGPSFFVLEGDCVSWLSFEGANPIVEKASRLVLWSGR